MFQKMFQVTQNEMPHFSVNYLRKQRVIIVHKCSLIVLEEMHHVWSLSSENYNISEYLRVELTFTVD